MAEVIIKDLREYARVPPEFLKRTESDLSAYLEKVAVILETVRREGDAALLRYGRDFDRVEASDFALRASDAEFAASDALVPADVQAAIRFAAENIRAFHEAQKPEEMWLKEVRPGAFAGERNIPIDSVACYVPRGKGAFPSVLMMTAIPALVAGVKRIVVITPPGPDGRVDPGTLYAAKTIGIHEIYKCGGAQGIAAVAYGTESVPRCLKVVGPGSPWVVAAKRLLRDVIDPGVPAGPSECVILADEHADGRLAALDLTIESEHGPDSSAYLVTNSPRVAEEALRALPEHYAHMSEQRAGYSRTVLSGPFGGILLVRDFDTAVQFVNDYAPEHLEIHAAEPMAVMSRITNAAEVLLGPHTPVSLGNFVLGPNAVLPTSRAAQTSSPLTVHDFLKRTSFGYVTAAGYPELARHAEVLARYEGFDGHANAVSVHRFAPAKGSDGE
jgi:histidinol dehydrogenase